MRPRPEPAVRSRYRYGCRARARGRSLVPDPTPVRHVRSASRPGAGRSPRRLNSYSDPRSGRWTGPWLQRAVSEPPHAYQQQMIIENSLTQPNTIKVSVTHWSTHACRVPVRFPSGAWCRWWCAGPSAAVGPVTVHCRVREAATATNVCVFAMLEAAHICIE